MPELQLGIHTTHKKLSDGRYVVYVYAFRGGPRLDAIDGPDKAKAMKSLATLCRSQTFAEKVKSLQQQRDRAAVSDIVNPVLDEMAEAAGVLPPRWETNRRYVAGLFALWKRSPEFGNLAETTQRDYKYLLKSFVEEFGDWSVDSFNDNDARISVIEWRNEIGSDAARKADYGITALGSMFKWARRQGYTNAHPTRELSRLYTCDRSEVIWTESDLDRLAEEAHTPLLRTVLLAAYTGLRQGDLIRLDWSQVHESSIRLKPRKTQKKGVVIVVPLIERAKALLDEMGRQTSGPVCTSKKKTPWTSDGLRATFGRTKARAGLENLHFHDLRGTAATHFIRMGLTPGDLQRIMGWSGKSIEGIMLRYVSPDEIANEMMKRVTLLQRQVTKEQQAA